jgi:lactate permease
LCSIYGILSGTFIRLPRLKLLGIAGVVICAAQIVLNYLTFSGRIRTKIPVLLVYLLPWLFMLIDLTGLPGDPSGVDFAAVLKEGHFISELAMVLGIIFAILGLKIFKIETPKELYAEPPKIEGTPKYSFVRALSPYIFVLLILPITLTVSKYIPVNTVGADGAATQIPLWNHLVGKLTYNGWIDILLFICSFLSIFTLRFGFGNYWQAFLRALKKVIPVFIIMASLYSVANIMKIPFISEMKDAAGNVTRESLSMIKLLAQDIAGVTGPLYPVGAVLIGAVGAFITGTNLGANQLFATMHMHAADILGINKVMTFAASNGGGSLGNMICPNNVTAACATVGITGEENKVMKRVIVMFLVTFLLYAVLSMLFVYVIFPNVSAEMTNVFARMG